MNIPSVTNSLAASVPSTNINSQLIYSGIKLEDEGNIDGAISYYKNLISNDKLAGFALTQLACIKNKYSRNDIEPYLENLSSQVKQSSLATKLAADLYLEDNNFDHAMTLYDKVIKGYPKNRQSVNAMFAKLFAYLNIKNDKVEAGQLLDEIKSLNLNDDEYLMNMNFAEYLLNGSSTDNANYNVAKQNLNKTTGKEDAVSIPKEYSLVGNYPNPFNPTTNIVYNLPRNSEVTIIIFDVLGNKVRSFNIAVQSAGKQELTWDGRDANGNTVASGTYLYHFTARSLEGKNEVFEKSGKLLLLR